MTVVTLTRGLYAIIDDDDLALIADRKWRISGKPGCFYACSGSAIRREMIYMHRLILAAPAGLVVDHLDGNGLNNRRSNLRLCTHRENIARSNTANKPNTTGFRGVVRSCRCSSFLARLGGKNLGSFRTAEDAAKAYDKQAKTEFGEFAVLNFPEIAPPMADDARSPAALETAGNLESV